MRRTCAAAVGALVLGCTAARSHAQGPPPDPGRRAELLKKYDKDGDGRLSGGEIEAARAARGQNEAARPMVRTEGGNGGNGSGNGLRHDERMQSLLNRFDANGDGKLDHGEMAALRAERRNHPAEATPRANLERPK